MKLLIDGDILIYRFACANTKVIHWGTGIKSNIQCPATAKMQADRFIRHLMKSVGGTEYLVCLSDIKNFRYSVLPSYKHNRPTGRPELYIPIKDHLIENHPTKSVNRLEADDVMGILSTKSPGEWVIASIDKDMLTVPGDVFDWRTNNGITHITEFAANKQWMLQTLTGDSTDGYNGCPGVGKKKGMALLEGLGTLAEMWRAVVAAYEAKGQTAQDALTQARLARILRATDYDFKSKQICLWTPDWKDSGV